MGRLRSRRGYTITFRTDDLPPVRNHRELSVDDVDGYSVASLIDRYSINSYMLDRGDLPVGNGEIVICIQAERPDEGPSASTVPAAYEAIRQAGARAARSTWFALVQPERSPPFGSDPVVELSRGPPVGRQLVFCRAASRPQPAEQPCGLHLGPGCRCG
ncbi:DUF1214 domain-containing protein [Pseudonocardia sp. RS11V-5]|uniref:DUF1214 domain-containing protein n=1 Tax=Pseudonocardia terrae TaxID=2905831 RepID=UPI001E48743F|nr:DUF1214 domain-containing protein [Pseudonocardia terrae]MCE3549846.1 DUF1214 domain-containing protein [Pseudonocardia terrae]